MLLTDRQVAELVRKSGLITGYIKDKISHFPGSDLPLMSFGQTSVTYDSRLDKVTFVYPIPSVTAPPPLLSIDPSNFAEHCELQAAPVYYHDGRAFAVLESKTFALVSTVESWKLPPNIAVLTQGKSSYTRLGLIYQVTTYDPGWEGTPTFTIHNPTPYHVRLFIGEGICQSLVLQTDQTPAVFYQGKYQNSLGITPAV